MDICVGMSLPSICGIGGSTVNLAFQVPARFFKVSKDFCASDFSASDFCVSVCAKVIVENNTRTVSSVNRKDFMIVLLKNSVGCAADPGESHGFGESLLNRLRSQHCYT